MEGTPPLSPDGCWYWDGSAWRSLVSPDGRSRWNGSAWVALTAPAGTAPATPPGAPAVDDRPSWLPADAEWAQSRPRSAPAETPAEAQAPAGAASAPPAATYPAVGAAPPARPFRIADLIGPELMAPVALVTMAALVAGWWLVNQVRPASWQPDVLVASHAQIGYQTGQTLRFAVSQEQHGQFRFPNGAQQDVWDNVTAVEDWRVISAGSDGSYTVGVKLETLSGTIDGQKVTFDGSRAKEAVLVVKPDGRVISGGTNGSAGGKATNSVPASDQFFSVLPDHDVKQGESWGSQWTRPNPLGTGQTTYRTTSTFVHYDSLSQFGSCAVVRTQATLPIDLGLNVRALLELTGDDTTGVPAGATISYKGNADDDMTTYVDMSSRLPVHMLDVSNFDLDMTFQNLSSLGLDGTIHWAGHQSGSMDLLELPKPLTATPTPARL